MSIKRYLDIAGDSGRFPALDGLRAIAIMLVLGRHGAAYWETGYDSWIWNLVINGWLGVDLFFVLSGFLISFHLLQRWPSEQANTRIFLKGYVIKRCLRILPLYICIIFLVCFSLIPNYEPLVEITVDQLRYHVLFLQDYFFSGIVVPLWSLGTEEKFYILAPFLIYFIRSRSPVFAVLFIISIIIILAISQELGVRRGSPDNYAAFFWSFRAPFHFAAIGLLMGSWVAMYVHYGWMSAQIKGALKPSFFWFSFMSFMIVLASGDWLDVTEWWSSTRVILFSTFIFTYMVLVAATSRELSLGFLGSKCIRIVARLSYPLYICHMTVIPSALLLTSELSVSNEYARFLVFMVIYLFLASLFAIVLHLAVEKPFLILKSKFK